MVPQWVGDTQGPANVDAIGLLVELGADLWSVMKDLDMETPLHMASRSGRLDIVEKLLRCGADLNKKTKVRVDSLLHTAMQYDQVRCNAMHGRLVERKDKLGIGLVIVQQAAAWAVWLA